jgi:hypothetical protein
MPASAVAKVATTPAIATAVDVTGSPFVLPPTYVDHETRVLFLVQWDAIWH